MFLLQTKAEMGTRCSNRNSDYILGKNHKEAAQTWE